MTDRQTDRQTDGQTDRQTELLWHIRAIAYMLSRVKTQSAILLDHWQAINTFGSFAVQLTVTGIIISPVSD